MEMARIPWVKTICEVGFNAGHSAISWLAADMKVNLYSFDLGKHDYVRPLAEYVTQRYPGRFQIILGDSRETMPKFIREHPAVKCDIMSIYGAHFDEVIQEDFNNFQKMANPKNLLHYDDYPSGATPIRTQEMGMTWEMRKQNGKLTELFKCSFFVSGRAGNVKGGFSVGHIHASEIKNIPEKI